MMFKQIMDLRDAEKAANRPRVSMREIIIDAPGAQEIGTGKKSEGRDNRESADRGPSQQNGDQPQNHSMKSA